MNTREPQTSLRWSESEPYAMLPRGSVEAPVKIAQFTQKRG